MTSEERAVEAILKFCGHCEFTLKWTDRGTTSLKGCIRDAIDAAVDEAVKGETEALLSYLRSKPVMHSKDVFLLIQAGEHRKPKEPRYYIAEFLNYTKPGKEVFFVVWDSHLNVPGLATKSRESAQAECERLNGAKQ